MKKKIKEFVKYVLACIIRVLSRVLYIFPVKNGRVIFSAYDGHHVCCNPKAIFEYMMKVYPEKFEYVWTLDNAKELEDYKGETIIAVKMRSLKFYYMKATAKVCVCNAGSFPELPLRKNQFQINTHHGGGAYKTAGVAIKGADTHINLKKLHWDAKNTSMYLSSSRYFSNEVVKKQKCFDGEIYEYGMPRNDVLIKHQEAGLREKVYRYYQIKKDMKILLYAPTYRDMGNNYDEIDVEGTLDALAQRFGGKWMCLIRMHYLGSKKKSLNSVISATDYPDMQELLAAADVLISDYSSSIWDYSFTGRPCLLYTPDVELYLEKRGLDTPIENWGFPVCRTNQMLCEAIRNWDDDIYAKKMDWHHDHLGACETGNASEIVSRRIYRECFGERGE